MTVDCAMGLETRRCTNFVVLVAVLGFCTFDERLPIRAGGLSNERNRIQRLQA